MRFRSFFALLAASLTCFSGCRGDRPADPDAGVPMGLDAAAADDGGPGPDAVSLRPDALPDSATDADVSGTPNIAEVFTTCPSPGALTMPSVSYPRGDGTRDMLRTTLTDPEAICNDGSPAVMFVRRATNPAQANEYVVMLHSGGGCRDADGCYERWCGIARPYNAGKMSSRFTPTAVDARGLFRDLTDDPTLAGSFGGANLVFVDYCSSDTWQGRRDTVLTTSRGESFRIHFRGHRIVEAVFDALEAGITSDSGGETLDPIGSGDELLFVGSSAGCVGLMQHADWARDRLAPAGVAVQTVADGCLRVDYDELGVPGVREMADAAIAAAYATVHRGHYDSYVDESCLAAHDDAEDFRCTSTDFLVTNHITTPIFVREDFLDPTDLSDYRGTPVTNLQHATAMHATLQAVLDAGTTGLEAADVARTPGIHGPACGQHIVMFNDDFFHRTTVDGRTVHDALRSWVDGGTATETYEPADGDRVCAMPTDDL